jgi:NifU-like protein involved in Fe-S cluster formation
MQIDLKLTDGVVQEAKFMTDGCGATIACGSMVTICRGEKPMKLCKYRQKISLPD